MQSRRHKCQSSRAAARWQGKRFSGFHLLVDSIIHLLADSIIHASRIFAHPQPTHGTLASVHSNAPIAIVLLLLRRCVLHFVFCPAFATVLRLLCRWETQLPILIRAVPDSKFTSTWVRKYFDLWSCLFLIFTASWMLLVVLLDLILNGDNGLENYLLWVQINTHCWGRDTCSPPNKQLSLKML